MEKNKSQTNSMKVTSQEDLKKPVNKYSHARDITVGSAMIHKEANEPPSECNPDNGAFFEERSNPLSSKGN